jgi:hypothetical protein
MNKIGVFVRHIRKVLALRVLIKKYDSYNVSNLYWYGSNIKKFISFFGIIKVAHFIFFKKIDDEISNNYNMMNLYYGDPLGDGIDISGATVWNCTKLENTPLLKDDKTSRYLENNSKVIIDEFKRNLDKVEIHPDNNSLTNNDGEWSGIFLYEAGGKVNEKVKHLFPKTLEIVEKLKLNKNFGFVAFSKLAPGTKVYPHCGSSNFRHRYHLGIDIPEPEKCQIRVVKKWLHWGQGKAFGFDDSFEHEVIHNGTKDRVVLMVDLWHKSLTDSDIEFLENDIFQVFGKERY